MADIFISYSKPDRDLVVKLSTFLEAAGWTVWWDKGLVPADAYRDEIMKQLASARAVITIWTETSHKYTLAEVDSLARKTGFRREAQWSDPEWPFAESLLVAV